MDFRYDTPVSLIVENENTATGGEVVIISRRPRRVLRAMVRDGRRVVLKGISEELLDHPEEVAALRKEYLLGLRAENHGVVRYYGFEQHPEFGPVIVMEYLDGITLKSYLAESPERKDKLPKLREREKIAFEIAETLAAIHNSGIIHRDLKPDNILIGRRDSYSKIIDFGNGDSEDFVMYKKAAGTELYGAPEQQKASTGSRASDVYSFGKILEDLLPERRFKSLRNACLSEEPTDRPDMERVARQLDPVRRKNRERIYLLAGISLAWSVLLGGGVFLLLRNSSAEEKAHTDTAERTVVEKMSDVENQDSDRVETGKALPPVKAIPEVDAEPVITEKESKDKVVEYVIREQRNVSLDSIVAKYVEVSDRIIARYGKISYDLESSDLRLRRAAEQNKLDEKLRKELEGYGATRIQVTQASQALWNHMYRETNKIDGDPVKKLIDDYGESE
ncbi:MAG: protein kinase [Muribaculaceae bacterium]|nr:protein kinase [Muribaculaceae bacterium]